MRILNICAYTWSIGGPPKIIYDHTQVALQEGHQVDILSPISPGDKPYPVPEGARVIFCQRTPGVSRVFREFSVELYQYLQKHIHEYDVIHCHGIWHWGSLAPFLIDRRVPKVITIHGLLDRWTIRQKYWKKWIMGVLAQKAFLRRADLIHINNTDEKEDLVRYLGYQHLNVQIIPNGIRMSDFATLPPQGTFQQKFALPADKKIVLFMSRLNNKKGLDLLLPAFQQYARQHDDALLVLAGPDDGYEQTAREFIRQHGLSNRIRMVGMLTGDDKKAALADATMFALPSYSEGFSMACLEALAAGTPALLSDRVGFGEALREHRAARLVDLNVDGVIQGLTELLQDEELRQQIRLNALNLLRSRYEIEVVAKQMLAAYEQILPGQASPSPVRPPEPVTRKSDPA